ncbi:unnamed protein product [Cunninghamella blakesleeana]
MTLHLFEEFSPYGQYHFEKLPHLASTTSPIKKTTQYVDFSSLLNNAGTKQSFSSIASQSSLSTPLKRESTYILATPQQHDVYPVNKNKNEYLEDDSLLDIDEELYTVNGTVVWSIGRHIINTFNYDNQNIITVLFAWFPHQENTYHFKKEKLSTSTTPNSTDNQQNKNKENNITIEKAACIILKDAIHVHFQDGFQFTIALPCPIQHVIPLPIGLLLEPEAYDFFLYITQPMQQLKRIYLDYDPLRNMSNFLDDDMDHINKINAGYRDNIDVKKKNDNININDSSKENEHVNSHQLVLATTTEKEMEWVIVTRRKSNGLHYLWKFMLPDFDEKTVYGDSLIKETSNDSKYTFLKTFERKRKSDALSVITNTSKINNNSSNKKRNISNSKNRNTNTIRNTSNNNNSNSINSNNSPVSFVNTTPSPSPGLSRSESLLSIHDSSTISSDTFMHDEFMDGSFFDFDPSSNRLGSNNDSRKPKKLEMKLIWCEQNKEIVSLLPKLNQKKKPTKSKKPRSSDADSTENNVIRKRSFGFISNNTKGNKVICIMNYDEGILSCLDLKELLDVGAPNGCQIVAKNAIPILVSSTKSLIVYLENSKLFLFKDHSLPPIPLPIPEDNIAYDIKDQVGDRFNIIVKQVNTASSSVITKTLRYKLQLQTKSVLIRDCMALLKNIWSITDYSQFEHQFHIKSNSESFFLQYQDGTYNIDEWDQWVLCLLSFLLPSLEIHATPENEKIDRWLSSVYKYQQSDATFQHRQRIINTKTNLELIFKTLKGLHLLYEDFSLTTLMKDEQSKLGYLLYYVFKLLKQSAFANNGDSNGKIERWLKYYENRNQISISVSAGDLPFSISIIQKNDELVDTSIIEYPFHFATSILYNRYAEFIVSCTDSLPYNDTMTMEESMIAFQSIFGIHAIYKVDQPHGLLWKLKLIWFIYYHITKSHWVRLIQVESSFNLKQELDLQTMKFMVDIILKLIEYGYRRTDINKLRNCRVFPHFFNTLDYIHLYPPLTFMITNEIYLIEFYRFICRNDMVLQLEHDPSTINKFYGQHSELFNNLKPLQKSTQLQISSFHTLMEYVLSDLNTTNDQATSSVQKNSDKLKHKMLKGDGRLEAISKLLDPTLLIEIGETDQPDPGSRDLQNEYQYQIRQLAHRTLSLPIGIALFNYHSLLKVTTFTDFTPFNFSVRLSHYRTIVNLNTDTFTNQYLEWPHFHYGVSASLGVSKDPSAYNDLKNALSRLLHISGDSLSSYHGGILFGLGFHPLQPLKEVPGYLSYRLMTDTKSTLAIMGYVLGVAITHRKSSDIGVTKILSVFLPTLRSFNGIGSSDSNAVLNDECLKQATCIFSLGLVYMESNNKDMANYLLKQIGHFASTTMRQTGYNGAASLCSGFALGMLFLGQGDKLLQTKDVNVYEELYHYITGEDLQQQQQPNQQQNQQGSQKQKHIHQSQQNNEHDNDQNDDSRQAISGTSSSSSAMNTSPYYPVDQKKTDPTSTTSQSNSSPIPFFLEMTTPAACVAIGLVYLKTNNLKMYKLLDVVDKTRPYLDYVRPDSLLIRVVCKNLIMWDDIKPTLEWVYEQLPSFMQQKQQEGEGQETDDKNNDDDDDEVDRLLNDQVISQAKYHMIAGGCLCIGLKYAGTNDNEVFKFLLSQLDYFISINNNMHATSFQQHLTKKSLGTSIEVLATSVSMVMAGTGNQVILDRLKEIRQKKFKKTSMTSHSTHGENLGGEDYSHYVSIHMSIGLLFLGHQGYTLSTRTMEGIIGLLASFYPFYPLTPDENRYHLQSLRHLWMLAIDTRWFIPVDINTMDIVKLPIVITSATSNKNNNSVDCTKSPSSHHHQQKRQKNEVNSDERGKRLIAPIVLPNDVNQLSLDSDNYLPIQLSYNQHELNDDYHHAIRQSGILFVQKKDSFLLTL